MTDGQYAQWTKDFCQDLAGKTDAQIAYACARFRRDAGNRFLPTPGQLLALCESPYADKHRQRSSGRDTGEDGFQPWGGACECSRCRNKTPGEKSFRASAAEHQQAAYDREQLDIWFKRQLPPSRLDEQERQTRRAMVDDLVRAGMDHEGARVKVMLDRTELLYHRAKPDRGRIPASRPYVPTPPDVAQARADALAARLARRGD